MKPGVYRNVSSIMIKLANDKNNFHNYYSLLDCGEGTYQQIYDHYGSKYTEDILLNLKLIYITHKHGDHMLGALKVLQQIDYL